jgi:hypothetical protein
VVIGIEFVVWKYGECKYLLISWSYVHAFYIVDTKKDISYSFVSTEEVWVCSIVVEVQGESIVVECEC